LAAAVVTAAATVAFTAGCSAGQITQTDGQVSSVPGANVEATMGPAPGRVGVRNVHLAYPGSEGYAAGASAPVEVRIFNDTDQPVVVRITSTDATGVTLGKVGESATASPSPPAPAAPAEITVAPGGIAVLSSTALRGLTLVGLKEAVRPGESVSLEFAVTGGPTLTVLAPVVAPLSAVPRPSAVVEE
jgi:hypothetical protein